VNEELNGRGINGAGMNLETCPAKYQQAQSGKNWSERERISFRFFPHNGIHFSDFAHNSA